MYANDINLGAMDEVDPLDAYMASIKEEVSRLNSNTNEKAFGNSNGQAASKNRPSLVLDKFEAEMEEEEEIDDNTLKSLSPEDLIAYLPFL